MALPMADETRPRWSIGVSWQRALRAMEAYPLERIGLAAIAAGIVLRIVAPFFMDLRSDGDTYAAMGHAWMMRHEFLMPYGDVTTWGVTPPGYSNHYPPAYPFYLGIVYTLFGFGLWQTKFAAVVVSLAAVGVVYWTSRDLYGKVLGALAGGLIALEPHLLWVTGAGFSENMVLLFFALTMWAILKSLKDDRYIILAGLFAALAYLSRASVGYFFVVAGGGGLLWRLAHRGWSVLANVPYLVAIVLFGSVMAAWATRNAMLFGSVPETITHGPAILAAAIGAVGVGLVLALPFAANPRLRRWYNFLPSAALVGLGLLVGLYAGALALFSPGELARTSIVQIPLWETSSYTRYVQNLAFEKPDEWRHALVSKVPLFLMFLVWYVVPFLPESWKATKRIREEQTSALWLSVVLVWIIAWAIASMFWVFEKTSLWWLDNHRYVVIGLLPLGWLLLREARTERASFRWRYALLAMSLFAACAGTILSPVKFADLRAAEHMDPYLREGDEVSVDGGTIKYAFYAYLTHPEWIRIYGWGAGDQHPDFIVSLKTQYDHEKAQWVCQPYEGYTHVAEYRQTFWNGGQMHGCLHALPEVVAERGIETGTLVVA